MDGLLIDSEPLWKEAEIKVFSTVGIDLTEKGCEETVGLRIDEVVDLWYERHPWSNRSKLQVTNDIIDCMAALIEEKGVAKKGVYDVVELIQNNDLPMAIATSSHQRLMDIVIQRLELNQFLNFGYSAEHELFGKPHPGVFLTTAQKLNIQPHQCLVFEDSLNGVIAAKAARMKVVAVPEKTHSFNEKLSIADQIISDLSQFKVHHLDELNQPPSLQFHKPFEPNY